METSDPDPTERVLVVEDDPHISDLILNLLRGDGREVEVARDGLEGIQRIKASDPRVIVLDLMLPGMNGFEIVRELAALDPKKLQRIIVLTAASSVTLEHFRERRIFRLIRKPFDMDELLSAVNECARSGH